MQPMGKHTNSHGFTLVEVIMVMLLIGIIAGITYSVTVPKYRERTYYTRATAELNAMGNALVLYAAKYNVFPPDVTRDVPAGIKEFLQSQASSDAWPDAPWPGTVYDYDNWPPDGNGPQQTYQISVRFCNQGQDATCKATAKKYLNGVVADSVLNSWDSYSSVYYCVKGSCRSHQGKPMTHPGYCINCGGGQKAF
jgi:prepilin-type N-terminal cleavage/methylation domain-containing protein